MKTIAITDGKHSGITFAIPHVRNGVQIKCFQINISQKMPGNYLES